jgi:hypothetical protein
MYVNVKIILPETIPGSWGGGAVKESSGRG